MKDADKIYRLTETLRELVDGLEETNWSSWQSTYKFDPALERAKILLNVIEDKS